METEQMLARGSEMMWVLFVFVPPTYISSLEGCGVERSLASLLWTEQTRNANILAPLTLRRSKDNVKWHWLNCVVFTTIDNILCYLWVSIVRLHRGEFIFLSLPSLFLSFFSALQIYLTTVCLTC
jgi:hypothetical protein